MKITFIFKKFEGYIPSGIGARSIPVERLAGWLETKMKFRLRFLKFSSGQTLQRLACLNEDIVLLELYLSVVVGFSCSDFIMLFI